jgi:signal transduction histidine kinase
MERRFRSARGESRIAMFSLQAIQVGTKNYVLVTGRDVTRRKRAEAQLQQAMKALRATDQERRSLLQRLVEVREEERRRLAEQLHDEPIQAVAMAQMVLGLLPTKLPDPADRHILGQAEGRLQYATAKLRELLHGLAPPARDRRGLGPSLRGSVENLAEARGVAFDLEDRLSIDPGPEAGSVLFRNAHEAVTNALKHADANEIRVVLGSRWNGFFARIVDDGRGFSLDDRQRASHIGLVSMQERAKLAGGWSKITSLPGAGTTVETWIPGQAARGSSRSRMSSA